MDKAPVLDRAGVIRVHDQIERFRRQRSAMTIRYVRAQPNQVWLADITYVTTSEGWLYVPGVLELGTRKLVGWSMNKCYMPKELSRLSGWRSIVNGRRLV